MNMYQKLGICLVMFVLFEYNVQQGEAASSSCDRNDTSCDDCVGLKDDCYWCENNRKCGKFEKKKLKNQKNCQGSDVYYRQCLVSSDLLIIILPSVAGGLLLIIGCCIYCCCCRKCCSKKKGIFDKEDKKLKREKNERKQLQDHRKAEREARNEEIRMKYGLKPTSGDSKYQRMDP